MNADFCINFVFIQLHMKFVEGLKCSYSLYVSSYLQK